MALRATVSGWQAPLLGLRLVFFTQPSLLRAWVIPMLISLLIFVLGVAALFHWGEAAFLQLWPDLNEEGSWGGRFLRGLSKWLFYLLGLGGVATGTSILSLIVFAPFNDWLSQQVEQSLGVLPVRPFSMGDLLKDILRTVGLEGGKVAVYLGSLVATTLAGVFIPGVGQVLGSVVGLGITALFWSVDMLDWPAARRNWPLSRRVSFLAAYPGEVLGFGLVASVLMGIPVLGMLFMPGVVAGGTLLFCGLIEEDPDSWKTGEISPDA